MGRRTRDEGLPRRFEGPQALEGLLELAGSPYGFDGALELLRDGLAAGGQPGELIPALFDGEPRFPDPSLAPRLFGNLLGLCDLLSSGAPIPTGSTGTKQPRPERQRVAPPPPFAPEAPSPAFIDAALSYLSKGPPKEIERLEHAFENREDALLSHLDELALSDEGYGWAREACFELFALMQLGWPAGTQAAPRGAFEGAAAATPEDLPAAFRSRAEAVGSSHPGAEAGAVQAAVHRYLSSLWSGRK